jgi:hypothetical protein
MKRRILAIVLAVLVGVLGTILVRADGDVPIYYVRLGHEGCQDGSEECPFGTLLDAVLAGKEQVCPSRMFEVYLWDNTTRIYEPFLSEWGERPTPTTGLPIANSMQALARYLQHRHARGQP